MNARADARHNSMLRLVNTASAKGQRSKYFVKVRAEAQNNDCHCHCHCKRVSQPEAFSLPDSSLRLNYDSAASIDCFVGYAVMLCSASMILYGVL